MLDGDDAGMCIHTLWTGAFGSTGIRGMHPGSLAADILKVAFAAQASNA